MKTKKTIAYFFVYFPFYPFTFICNEILSLIHNGFQVEIFVLHKGERRELHKDFQILWDKISVIKSGSKLSQLFCYYYFRVFYPHRMRYLKNIFSPPAEQHKIYLFKDPYLLSAFKAAWYLKKRNDIGYLHSHFTGRPSTLLYILSQLLKIPRGFTSHADSFANHKYKLLCEQVKDSEIVFASTHTAKINILKKCGSIDEEKIIVKPGGVNLDKFQFQHHIKTRTKLISICRFDPKKGMIYLAKACDLLIQKGLEIQCILVGDAPGTDGGKASYEEVVQYIHDNGLTSHFTLTGALTQEEYIRYMNECAIIVAPYIVTESGERDGVPTILIEAMAMGIVPVATDAGAITELVEHNINGLIVPQKDHASLANQIERLIKDYELFERLRNNARNTIELSRDIRLTEQIFVNKIEGFIGSPIRCDPKTMNPLK